MKNTSIHTGWWSILVLTTAGVGLLSPDRVAAKSVQKCPEMPFDISQEHRSSQSLEPKIFEGCIAERKWFPWHVGLVKADRQIGPRGNVWCGGALISDRWVITAAHCVYRMYWPSIAVYIGPDRLPPDNFQRFKHRLAHTPIFPREYTDLQKTAYCRRHGKNDPHCLNFDLALLKLAKPIKIMAGGPQKIDIETEHERIQNAGAGEKNWNGRAVWTAGWGGASSGNFANNTLLYSKLNFAAKTYCRNELGPAMTEYMFCTEKIHQSTCSGDSGGGAVVREIRTKSPVLVGLVSWGSTKCRAYSATAFTRLSKFNAWVNKIVAGGSPGPVSR